MAIDYHYHVITGVNKELAPHTVEFFYTYDGAQAAAYNRCITMTDEGGTVIADEDDILIIDGPLGQPSRYIQIIGCSGC